MEDKPLLVELMERLIDLWINITGNNSFYSDEENKYIDDKSGWDSRRNALLHKIQDNFDKLIAMDDYPKLMQLSALDEALSENKLSSRGVLHRYRDYQLVSRSVPLGETKYSSQRGHPGKWLKFHRIIREKNNNISIKYKVADKAIYDNLKEKCMDGLNVYCGTFLDGSDLDWSKPGPPQVGDLAKRGQEVFGHLEQARRLSAHVVLLPELTLPPVLRQEVACWLADHENLFCLVVPGSFHQMDKISEKLPVNRALLLDGKGRKIFSHDKILPFGVGDENELIHAGNSLTLWDSPLGVMMLAICRDFLEEDDYLRLPWQSLEPDWVWVPSMSENTSAHGRQMNKMVRCCETRTVIANQRKNGFPEYKFPGETFLFSLELTKVSGKDYQMVKMAIPKEWQKR